METIAENSVKEEVEAVATKEVILAVEKEVIVENQAVEIEEDVEINNTDSTEIIWKLET